MELRTDYYRTHLGTYIIKESYTSVVEEGERVICSVPARADRLVPPRLTGTGNVLTSRLCHDKCHAGLITVTLLQALQAPCSTCLSERVTRATGMRVMSDVRRSDARYSARHPGLRMSNARPGDRISFLAGSGAPGVPGHRYCHDVTKTRGHVSRVTLTMSIFTIGASTPEW